MILTKLHNPDNGPMQVVGLMSGSGSNLRKILELEKNLKAEQGTSPFTVVALFSDNAQSNATKIGKEFDLPVVVRDIGAFYAARGKPRRDMETRRVFDTMTVHALSPYQATVAAYAGYMSIVTTPLIKAFLGANVHPADLVIKEGDRRKYTGDNAVRDAILARETQLRSSMHIVEEKVDYGKILMRSAPLQIILPEGFDPNDEDLVTRVAQEHQERLKQVGDWEIFPKTLLYMAEGRYARDAQGNLYFDGSPIPQGLSLG